MQAVRAVVAAAPPRAQACEDGAGTVVHWAEAPADDATNPALEEWPVGVWPADPLSSGRRRALTRRRRAGRPPPRRTRSTPSARSTAGRPAVEQWVRDADLLLRERARHASPTVDVPLPSHLSVSALVTLRRDPAELARRLRRPMPAAPAPQARRGTAFHAWLEERFGAAKLVDLDELPGSGDEFAAPDGALAELQEAFLASEWADRQPAEVEVPFETPLGPLTLRGRIDAVYADADGRYEVIDWKTGPPPSGAELAAAGGAAGRLPARLVAADRRARSSGSAPASTTSPPASPCARSTCSTRPACSPWSPAPRRTSGMTRRSATWARLARGRSSPRAGGRSRYVFASVVPRPRRAARCPAVRAPSHEDEGLTARGCPARGRRPAVGLAYDYVAGAHHAAACTPIPAAVGMTAAVSRVLADAGPELQRDRRLLPRPPAGAVGPGRRGASRCSGRWPPERPEPRPRPAAQVEAMRSRIAAASCSGACSGIQCVTPGSSTNR